MRITFDPAKNAANVRKHGRSLADAALVYLAERKVTLVSSQRDELRKVDIARIDPVDTVLVLVYVERDDEIRAISLRNASRKERRRYAGAKED